MMHRTVLQKIFAPVVVVLAAVYFLIDALVLSILRPILRKIAYLKLFQFMTPWISSLGPYPTLILFLIPLILLEPIKPFSAYLIASGHFISGILFLVIGEALKISIVERIFHIGRDKLMTIVAFAKIYNFVSGWLVQVQGLPAWQAVKRRFHVLIYWVRKLKLKKLNA